MKAVFLAADDPLYLPELFERVLAPYASKTALVGLVPPLYRRQTSGGAAWRYFRTFGLADTLRLSARVATARVKRRSIAAVCRRFGVACEVVEDVNAQTFLARLRGIEPNVIVSVSCPQVFRRPLIELAPGGLLNVHGAILPAYRGVLPGFWMLANGEKHAGVSVHLTDDGIDTGDLCGQEVFEIRAEESLDAFLRRSKAIAAELLLEVLASVEAGKIERRPLDPGEGSYYSWPDREAVARFRARGRRVW